MRSRKSTPKAWIIAIESTAWQLTVRGPGLHSDSSHVRMWLSEDYGPRSFGVLRSNRERNPGRVCHRENTTRSGSYRFAHDIAHVLTSNLGSATVARHAMDPGPNLGAVLFVSEKPHLAFKACLDMGRGHCVPYLLEVNKWNQSKCRDGGSKRKQENGLLDAS